MAYDYSLHKTIRILLDQQIGTPVNALYSNRMSVSGIEKVNCDFSNLYSKFGSNSMRFYGNESYLSGVNKSPLNIINHDQITQIQDKKFTVSLWIRFASVGKAWQGIVCDNDSYGLFLHNNKLSIYFYGDNACNTTIVAGTWYHIAFTRDGSVYSLYIDGQLEKTINSTYDFKLGYIGGYINCGNYSMDGYVCDVFVDTSRCLYSSNFTPPSQQLRSDLSDFSFSEYSKKYNLGFTTPIPNIIQFSEIKKLKINDFFNGGSFNISGTVKEKASPSNLPLSRLVRLHRKIDGYVISQKFSNQDGTYSFPYLKYQEYYVTSFDHTKTYNAVIQDSIFPT